MRRIFPVVCKYVIPLLFFAPAAYLRADTSQFSFLRRPDIHGDSVVFTSEGDLWLGSITSKSAVRITTHSGIETNAHFSPDGSKIAFTGQYDGRTDVYLMPTEGGEPKRLTFDPSTAVAVGWNPNGKSILFKSQRGKATVGSRLFEVAASGGMPHLLPIPQVSIASMNRDGRRIAYVPISIESQHWFRYKGGQADSIWLTDIEKLTFKRLTNYPGVETNPCWIGDDLYFVSERDGIANLYRMDLNSGKAVEVTHYTDYPVRSPSSDGKRIIFQRGFGLALFDPAAGDVKELKFNLHSDRMHTRQRKTGLTALLNTVSIGPTGKRVVLESRGQLVSIPAEQGEPRILASLPGSRSKFPAWSPDGKQIAFVSDRSGEEQIWVCPASGEGYPRQITRDHKGPLGKLIWSPDGKWLASGDIDLKILLIDVKSGISTLVDQQDRGGSYDWTNYSYRFSPDSKWLTYAKTEPNWNQCVYLYNITTTKRTPVTSSEMNCYAPAFDFSGKYLVYLADRQFDPNMGGASHFFSYDKITRVNLLVLTSDTPSPSLIESSEEGTTEKVKPAAKDSTATRIDLDGLSNRSIEVGLPAGYYQKVDCLNGRLLVLEANSNPAYLDDPSNMPCHLIGYDLKKKEPSTISGNLTAYEVSADQNKLLLQNDKSISIIDSSSGPANPGAGKVDLSRVSLDVDPPSEWKQMLNESWRLARDLFYDPAMHGVDWNAVKTKYLAQLPAVGDRNDLNTVLGDLIAELNTGHSFVRGGDTGMNTALIPMGYLGADLEPVTGMGAVRIVKMFEGDGFDLDARSPLLEPGLNLKAGDYIVAVNGEQVHADEDFQALLQGTVGRVVALSINSKPSLEGARIVRVKPMATESMARYYELIASRRLYVEQHGGGSIGYIHLPDMIGGGLQEYTKHYFPNNQTKAGLIYDVRDNGGGFISAMLLLQMAHKPYAYFKPRFGTSWTRADWSFAGYSAALCNEFSSSNAEEFSDAFQRLKLGPVIGARTWGGEVGSGNGYHLLDGGVLYVPNYGEWAPDGKWIIEGPGFIPDIAVAQDPAAVLAGADPQLDRAITILKEEIRKHPVVRPLPPPFPNKAYHPRGAH